MADSPMRPPESGDIIIASAISDEYLLPLKVMLTSLKEHLSAGSRPVLYLFNRELTDEQLEGIGGVVETHTVVPDSRAMQGLPRQRGFVPEAAFPLLLPNLLPESVDRVLFLDPDLLVMDDITKIWETDLCGTALAAVADGAIPFCSSPRGVKIRTVHGIPDSAPYFNAGVMLIDVARWRALDVPNRAREYVEKLDGQSDFFHQEALNAILWDNWLPLDEKWNLIASLTGRRYRAKDAANSAPGIVHFAGRFKPWRIEIGGAFADSYRNYFHRFGADRSNATLTEKLLGFYDRHLRDYLYVCERSLWNRRLI